MRKRHDPLFTEVDIMHLIWDYFFLFTVSRVCTHDCRVQEALQFYFHAGSSFHTARARMEA